LDCTILSLGIDRNRKAESYIGTKFSAFVIIRYASRPNGSISFT